MYTYAWYHWITFFFLYSFFGWIFESAYVSLKSKRFVNRGFLRLPMLPLYGTGAVMMLWISLPFQDSLVLVYISGVLGATALEYVTGYVMERLFKVRYWDYSKQPFNLHGYICLSSSIAWGFLTILMTEVLHVAVARVVLRTPPYAEFSFIGIVGALFAVDTVRSVRAAMDLAKALDAMTRIRTELDELQVQMALLRADTSQKLAGTSQKLAELKEETLHKLRTETDSRLAAAHLSVSRIPMPNLPRPNISASNLSTANLPAAKTAVTEAVSERLASMNERIKALAESRTRLHEQISSYHRSLLRRNPTAASRKFADALTEFKEIVKEKRK